MKLALRRYSRAVALVLSGALATQSVAVGTAHAGMVATDAYVGAQTREAARADRDALNRYLDRGEVREALAGYGVDPAEAKARVASLSDAEVARLASNVGTDPAGGLVGLVVFAGIVALIVLLVADATDNADVF